MLQFVCRKRGEARVSNHLLLRMDPSLSSAHSPPSPSPSPSLLLLMPESLASSLGLRLGDRVSAGHAALDSTHGLDAESNLSVEAEGEEVQKISF